MFDENIATIISSPFELLSFGKYNYWGVRKLTCTAHGAARGALKQYLSMVNPWHRALRYFDRMTLCSGYTFVNVGSENIDTRCYLDINMPREEVRAKFFKKVVQ